MKNLNNQIINKILLIRLSSLGDILLTTKTIRLLKKRFPNAEIDFCTSINFKDILKYNPYINKIIDYDKKKSVSEILKYKHALYPDRASKYDLIVDLQHNLRSKIFSCRLSQNILKVKKHRLRKLRLVYCKTRFNDNYSVVDNYNKTLENLIEDDNLSLELWLKDETNYLHIGNKIQNSKLRICIAPGATHFTKQWGREKYSLLVAEIFNKYKAEIILLGSYAEKEICDYIEGNNAGVINLAGKTSILEAAEIISESNLLISNDSGMMHVAAARQVPVIAIFGSTVTDFGFRPYKCKNIVIEADNVPCRPCTHIGRAKCPKLHFNCMNKISLSQVFDAFETLIKQ